MDPVHVLRSPDAGRGRAETAAATVMSTIREEGFAPVDITGRDVEESRRAVAEVVADEAERIVVAGGDGLVNLALQSVAGSNTVLGVVPVGTGNDFARAFGVEEDGPIDAATRRALGAPAAVDAIRSEQGWVASVATAGFSGDVNRRANRLKWPRGPKRYTVATLLEIPRLRSRPVELVVDGEVHHLDVALLAVANTAWFGGGMYVCPDARPDDGVLDVIVVESIGRLALLRYFPKVFTGAHLSHPKTTLFRGSSISIESEGLAVWGDGEPMGVAPIELTAVSDAISLAI